MVLPGRGEKDTERQKEAFSSPSSLTVSFIFGFFVTERDLRFFYLGPTQIFFAAAVLVRFDAIIGWTPFYDSIHSTTTPLNHGKTPDKTPTF